MAVCGVALYALTSAVLKDLRAWPMQERTRLMLNNASNRKAAIATSFIIAMPATQNFTVAGRMIIVATHLFATLVTRRRRQCCRTTIESSVITHAVHVQHARPACQAVVCGASASSDALRPMHMLPPSPWPSALSGPPPSAQPCHVRTSRHVVPVRSMSGAAGVTMAAIRARASAWRVQPRDHCPLWVLCTDLIAASARPQIGTSRTAPNANAMDTALAMDHLSAFSPVSTALKDRTVSTALLATMAILPMVVTAPHVSATTMALFAIGRRANATAPPRVSLVRTVIDAMSKIITWAAPRRKVAPVFIISVLIFSTHSTCPLRTTTATSIL